LLDNPLPFGEINIILNQDIIHHFQDTYGKIVLVKCGCYINQVQKYSTILKGNHKMFRSQASSRSWNLDSSYTNRGILYCKIFTKNSHVNARIDSRMNLSFCWKNYNFYSFWITQV